MNKSGKKKSFTRPFYPLVARFFPMDSSIIVPLYFAQNSTQRRKK